ncbi:Uncharacterised protein [Shimwellia blattae]|nr:hypothetical protein EB105725_31_00290 [Shimwellia blattae DSM 4481 = NBRC 105725]VDY63519.1 Uncharacterised protein [Shimwellia blattae]VEC21495.1 Uncharacterised protein [Shimwellia blattae]
MMQMLRSPRGESCYMCVCFAAVYEGMWLKIRGAGDMVCPEPVVCMGAARNGD